MSKIKTIGIVGHGIVHPIISDILETHGLRAKSQSDEIAELKAENERLKLENETMKGIIERCRVVLKTIDEGLNIDGKLGFGRKLEIIALLSIIENEQTK